MPSKVTICGCSDDLIEVEGCEGADEFWCYQADEQEDHGALIFEAPDGTSLIVKCLYSETGVVDVCACSRAGRLERRQREDAGMESEDQQQLEAVDDVGLYGPGRHGVPVF